MSNALSEVTKLKRQIYTRLARLAWQNRLISGIEDVPDQILTENQISYRCCEHKERAILRERIRLALGLPAAEVDRRATLGQMAELALKERSCRPAAVEMMAVACDRCPIDRYVVTDACRNCVAHYCQNACPKGAITIVHNRAYIDRNRCIECGRCAASCSYHAILQITRPCEHACAVGAINSDEQGIARIDGHKCVSCGACISACPFGSISDHAQIVPVIQMLAQAEKPVYALIAPAFVGQFGPKVSPDGLKGGLLALGFSGVIEVALGAEEVARAEASEYLARRAAGDEVMTTSCCPAFVGLIRQHYPEQAGLISHTPSPMEQLAATVKATDSDALVVFIGPCIAKKTEASRSANVDAVLTFEEIASMLVARDINLAAVAEPVPLADAGSLGRGFAKSGGVANAVLQCMPEGVESPQVVRANGLTEAVAACDALRAGTLGANLLEGMACPGGCVAGPGTLINPIAAEKLLDRFCRVENVQTKKAGN